MLNLAQEVDEILHAQNGILEELNFMNIPPDDAIKADRLNNCLLVANADLFEALYDHQNINWNLDKYTQRDHMVFLTTADDGRLEIKDPNKGANITKKIARDQFDKLLKKRPDLFEVWVKMNEEDIKKKNEIDEYAHVQIKIEKDTEIDDLAGTATDEGIEPGNILAKSIWTEDEVAGGHQEENIVIIPPDEGDKNESFSTNLERSNGESGMSGTQIDFSSINEWLRQPYLDFTKQKQIVDAFPYLTNQQKFPINKWINAKLNLNKQLLFKTLNEPTDQSYQTIHNLITENPLLLCSTNGNNCNTPLHCASKCGPNQIVDLLIKAGADPNAKNYCYRDTPLHTAILENKIDAVKLLLPVSNKEAQDHLGDTPLHLAVCKKSPDILEVLLNNDCNIEAKTFIGNTPLYLAARNGNVQILKKLLLKPYIEIDNLNQWGISITNSRYKWT